LGLGQTKLGFGGQNKLGLGQTKLDLRARQNWAWARQN